MLRIVPAFLGLGLAVLWVVGMSVDASVLLTWSAGIAAALCLATVGLIPDRQAAPVAGLCLGMIAAGLLVLWLVGLRTGATPWLTWWIFVAACLALVAAFGAALQGLLDRLRSRP